MSSPPPPPPPAQFRCYKKRRNGRRPSDDLRPDNEKLIQFYMDKEFQEVWIYLPQSARRSAVCDDMLGRTDQGLYWEAVELHVAAREQIRKDDHDEANSRILQNIVKATTSGLTEGIRYVNELADRPPFDGGKVARDLLKLWRWKNALTHQKKVKVYLGYLPYCNSSTNWRAEPAYEGTYYLEVETDTHFIHTSGAGWTSFKSPFESDIQARLAIIEEVRDEIGLEFAPGEI